MLLIIFKQLLFISILLGFSLITGLAALRRFSFASFMERIALSMAAGWAMLSIFAEVLAFLHLFTITYVLFGMALAALFCFPYAVQILRRQSFSAKEAIAVMLRFENLVILFIFAGFFYATFYPPVRWDAISYHLPSARAFIAAQGICDLPHLRFAVAPQLADLLFAVGLMGGTATFANAISFIETLLFFLLVYAFAARYFNKGVALTATVFLFSIPVLTAYAVVAYAEAIGMLFCFAAFYAVWRWLEEDKREDILLGGVFFGLALSVKYYAYLFFIAVILCTVFFYPRKVFKKNSLHFLGVCFFMVAPWCLRSWVYSGDLFYPLFSSERNDHVRHMLSFGYGAKFIDLLFLPYRLAVDDNTFQGCVSIFIPMALTAIFFLKAWTRRFYWMGAIAVFYLLVWFYNFQIGRYLSPVLPLAAIFAAWAVDQAARISFMPVQGFPRLFTLSLLLADIFFSFAAWSRRYPPPFNDGDRRLCLYRSIETMPAIDFLNRLPAGKVYTFYDERPIFYHKNATMGDWEGSLNYHDVNALLNKNGALSQGLKRYGVRYFLVNRMQMIFRRADVPPFNSEQGLRLIYQDQVADVYEVL